MKTAVLKNLKLCALEEHGFSVDRYLGSQDYLKVPYSVSSCPHINKMDSVHETFMVTVANTNEESVIDLEIEIEYSVPAELVNSVMKDFIWIKSDDFTIERDSNDITILAPKGNVSYDIDRIDINFDSYQIVINKQIEIHQNKKAKNEHIS